MASVDCADNCKTEREQSMFGDLVRLIWEIWRYLKLGDFFGEWWGGGVGGGVCVCVWGGGGGGGGAGSNPKEKLISNWIVSSVKYRKCPDEWYTIQYV